LHTLIGTYTRAEAAAKPAIELQEKYISGKEVSRWWARHTRLGYCYYRQGRYDEAIAEYQRELEFLTRAIMRCATARSRTRTEARRGSP